MQNEVIDFCKDARLTNAEFRKLAKLKSKKVEEGLSMSKYSNLIRPKASESDAFLNILREEWNTLNRVEQNEIFYDILLLLEDFRKRDVN